jgi:hypothetical protein
MTGRAAWPWGSDDRPSEFGRAAYVCWGRQARPRPKAHDKVIGRQDLIVVAIPLQQGGNGDLGGELPDELQVSGHSGHRPRASALSVRKI